MSKGARLVATITDDAYKKSYRMRVTGRNGLTIETSIPKAVVEREANKAGLPVNEFRKRYKLQWLYDDFGGAFAQFIPAKERVLKVAVEKD